MALENDRNQYGTVARTFHWLVFVIIAGMLALGLYFSELPGGDRKDQLKMIHASFGFVLILTMLARLAWRLRSVRPDHPAGAPAWQNTVATWLHRGLYVLIFGQIIIGVLIGATAGRGLPFFGLFEIPVPFPESERWHDILEEWHVIGWQLIAIAVGIHVIAAVYHHFIARDDVLKRMTTGVRR